MFQEIRLHGHINETIEYFASGAAHDIYRGYFYEPGDEKLRLFSGGSELVLDSDGFQHRGNGGTFCEYMFGVEQPLSDLAKGDVRNRLVLYGATYQENELVFTQRTDGGQSYETLFFDGNAVCNYLFFLSGDLQRGRQAQQEDILRLLGKRLKRSVNVGMDSTTELIAELGDLLSDRFSLYLVCLVHKKHRSFFDAFSHYYLPEKTLSETAQEELNQLAAELDIDRYQQERIRIDVMYKHPDNRRIVDEYKNILIDCNLRGSITATENARLTRLKTLSVRNKIPVALFFTLDEMLRHDKLVHLDEQDYLAETRQILEGVLLHEHQIDSGINHDDMIRLLRAKQQASDNRDHVFEQILLETGKACDEKIRDGADIALLESFSQIVTFFDRFDSTSAHISQLAFMESVSFGEQLVRSLLGSRQAFEELSTGLFYDLFFKSLLGNKYLGRYGRRKLVTLHEGLAAIADGSKTIDGLVAEVTSIQIEEQLYRVLLDVVKERIRNLYSRYTTSREQEELRLEVEADLRSKGTIEQDIPKELFNKVVVNIKKEAIYLHSLLPEVITKGNTALREDFLDNSGLDRFYIEELEREYFELHQLDPERLQQIRKGSEEGKVAFA
ncbi:MAG: TIGR04442 family protein [Desulfuromonas sp.]|nr:MAG: TIGR04442 family protein [Desulfuromonas sp.]